jgi:hypothetical protein
LAIFFHAWLTPGLTPRPAFRLLNPASLEVWQYIFHHLEALRPTEKSGILATVLGLSAILICFTLI